MIYKFLKDRVELHCGDCLEMLQAIPDNSIDSCVCDPPYHLTSIVKRFGGENAAPAKTYETGAYGGGFDEKGTGTGAAFARMSRGFMGKQWDGGDIAFRPETWAAVYRVLKPGGYLLAFSGTRTYHRMACAIEDAGFEVRDMVSWLYGSGFPKSHDVSKAIDKARDEDEPAIRAICRSIRLAMDNLRLKSKDLVHHFDGCHPRLIDHWAARDTDSQPALPTWRQWQKLQEVLSLDVSLDEEVMRLNSRKGEPSDDWKSAEVIGERTTVAPGLVGMRFDGDKSIRAASDAAREWAGWGTALKPALEPICMARKPLSEGTVAANVLKHGTGAINIGACRVGTEITTTIRSGHSGDNGIYGDDDRKFERDNPAGRWPANVIHDGSEEVTAAFPDAGKSSGGGGLKVSAGLPDTKASGHFYDGNVGFGDSGSAARFFYSAKADSSDRIGSKHPTVKPVDLMQYLVRLVTPKNGIVLDPFSGTGTTGEAAWREGMRAILVEREAEYQADIRRRMALCLSGPDERSRESIKAKTKDKPMDAGPLFAATEAAE